MSSRSSSTAALDLPPPAVVEMVAHVVVMPAAAVKAVTVVAMVVMKAMAAAQTKNRYGHKEAHVKEFLVHRSDLGVLVHVIDYARREAGRFSSFLFCTIGFLLFTSLL